MGFSICFSAGGGRATLFQNGRTACEILSDASRTTVRLWTDFSDKPLTLASLSVPGEPVRLLLYSCRIELYLHGELADEEWPCGNYLLTEQSRFEGDFAPELCPLSDPEPTRLPDVIRAGLSPEELRLPGVNIGDCMPYAEENDPTGRYHLFYLYDRHHHASKWRLGAHQWAHASTADFKTWDAHPMAVEITEGWEGSICTGSVCRAGDRWYAWYAVRMADRSPARITYAVSEDCIHFRKCGSYFSMPEGYEPTSARDPMVFRLDGVYHMFVTTSRCSDGSGCLAHLVNGKMAVDGWRDAGVVLAWAELCTPEDPARLRQPECPDYFRMGDYWYLVFSIGGKARYGYAKEPFGPWTFPAENGIPCGSVPKSAVLPGTGRRIFVGFEGEGGYGGRLRAAEAFGNPDGTLRFAPPI